MKIIKTVGVVGAGTMGAAIAQKFAQENFKVILADREMSFVERGIGNITKMLNEGIERKVFSQVQVNGYLANISGTADLKILNQCDLIVEAIFEDFQAKAELFSILSLHVNADTILATNTSSFSVTDLSAYVTHPKRFVGLHYFYHAAKNRLVEIIPGKFTLKETIDAVKAFSIQSGKDAISCKDAYGFVVNRFFVPWLNESVRLLEENIANIPTIDAVCMEIFGIGMGPFALMNATGVPVAYHSEKTLERFGQLYLVSELLKTQALSGKMWDFEGEVSNDASIKQTITDRMLGVVFFVCSQLLDERVCYSVDINRGAKIGLKWRKGPIDLMQTIKKETVLRYVASTAERYAMNMPFSIGDQYWKMQYVDLEINEKVAVLTINRPEDLNALNEEVMKQLDEQFTTAEINSIVETIYITGTGKAFVAGADIKFFIKNIKANKIADIETFTAYGQYVFNKIDKSSKKVIAIINGLALGGGLELALCADVILALPNAMMAFPETGIGIYPALGGTQRSAKKIGKALSKYLVFTGTMLSANDALDAGIVDGIISTEKLIDLTSGSAIAPDAKSTILNAKWSGLKAFFEKNILDKIINEQCDGGIIPSEMLAHITKSIKRKAPIALRLANQLIEEAKGTESELTFLQTIFTTSDALLGLSNIGKIVEYEGK